MAEAKQLIERLAQAEGFDVCGIAATDVSGQAAADLRRFIKLGHHGDMGWLAETAERRSSPRNLWPEARSVIMLAMNYAPPHDPLPELNARDRGYISVYARNRDYHDVIKGKLKQIAGRFAAQTQSDVKVFVDTAPLMEKPAAQRAGIGWQGKHTNLVSRQFGSWLFLGAILTTAKLEPDEAEIDHCGSCRACLDICPTNAFPAPYRLDARRCISYLTIEHKGHIASGLRAAMGNRIYGCDDCLAVCPWNKFAQHAKEYRFHARDDLCGPALAELAALDDAAFRKRFSGSPVKRIGRARFLRNVLIAIGNSNDKNLAQSARNHLTDDNPLVRAMAVWALSKLADRESVNALSSRHLAEETDSTVVEEWRNAVAEEQVR